MPPLFLFQLSSFIKAFDYIVSLTCCLDFRRVKTFFFESKIYFGFQNGEFEQDFGEYGGTSEHIIGEIHKARGVRTRNCRITEKIFRAT